VLYLGVVVVVEVGVVSGAGVVVVVEVGIVCGGGVARAVVMPAKNEDNVAALELAVVVEVVVAVGVEVVHVGVGVGGGECDEECEGGDGNCSGVLLYGKW
jgi:hypothetical protein